jgi:hypothetical protein
MAVKKLPVSISIHSSLRFGENVIDFWFIVILEIQSTPGTFSFLPME